MAWTADHHHDPTADLLAELPAGLLVGLLAVRLTGLLMGLPAMARSP